MDANQEELVKLLKAELNAEMDEPPPGEPDLDFVRSQGLRRRRLQTALKASLLLVVVLALTTLLLLALRGM